MNASTLPQLDSASAIRWPRRWHLLVLCSLTSACLAVWCWPAAGGLWQLDRAAFFAGQWWRLQTGHLVHWSGDQLFWDLLVFVALSVLCARRDPRRWLICLLTASVLIPLSIVVWQPAIQTYRGLSGLDTALFALLATRLGRESWQQREWRRLAIVICFVAAFFAKTGYELSTGNTVFVHSHVANFVSLPLAHIAGALTGALLGVAAGIGERVVIAPECTGQREDRIG